MVKINNILYTVFTILSYGVFADGPDAEVQTSAQVKGHGGGNKGANKGGHSGGRNGGKNSGHGKTGKHNGKNHHFKSHLIRHVDGHHRDFWRCPGPKVHCHNKHERDFWNDHNKRCWIIDESRNGYCYAWLNDGCHIYKKYKIDDC